MLQQQNYDLKNLTTTKVNSAVFESSDPQEIEIQSLLIQTGYLTIKNYQAPLYQLGFPNFEVKKSFYDSVTTRYAKIGKSTGEGYIIQLIEQIQNDEVDNFFATLNIFLANVPYNITLKDEKYYQSLFYAILKLIGLTIETEVHTNQGRIDCVIETEQIIYVIEFKLNASKEIAIEQIQTKQYAQKYQSSRKLIKMIGVEFDHTKRTIAKWLVASN